MSVLDNLVKKVEEVCSVEERAEFARLCNDSLFLYMLETYEVHTFEFYDQALKEHKILSGIN